MLRAGLYFQTQMVVSPDNTAEYIGSGDMAVLATPAMAAMMENAAMLTAAPYLPTGSTTVGSSISISHLRPSAVGAVVTARAELIEVDDRRLKFRIEAYEDRDKIGEGEHVRYIVDREKFLSHIGK